jgi:hypothetical protein
MKTNHINRNNDDAKCTYQLRLYFPVCSLYPNPKFMACFFSIFLCDEHCSENCTRPKKAYKQIMKMEEETETGHM